MRAALVLSFALVGASAVRAQTIETPVPFDSAHRVVVVTPPLAERLHLAEPAWPLRGEYRDVRLYALSGGGFVLVALLPNGALQRYELTDAQRSTLGAAIDVALLASGRPSGQGGAEPSEPAGNGYARHITVLGAFLYAPLAASLFDDGGAAGAAGVLTAGGAFFISYGAAQSGQITRAQADLSANLGVASGLAALGVGYAATGNADKGVRGATLAAATIGTIAGVGLGHHLTDAEAHGVTVGIEGAGAAVWAVAAGAGATGRGMAAAVVASEPIGYLLGVNYPRIASYTVTAGDLNAMQTAGLVGGLVGGAVISGGKPSPRQTAIGVGASYVAGLLIGDLAIARPVRPDDLRGECRDDRRLGWRHHGARRSPDREVEQQPAHLRFCRGWRGDRYVGHVQCDERPARRCARAGQRPQRLASRHRTGFGCARPADEDPRPLSAGSVLVLTRMTNAPRARVVDLQRTTTPHPDVAMKRARLAALLTAALAVVSAAQAPKKVLTQADWDKWKSINAPALSNDGKWAAYTLIPQVGDGELVIRSTSGTTEFRVPRGFLGRPNNTPGGLRGPAGGTGEEDPTGPTAAPAQITADSRFVIVSTQASQAEVEQAGRARNAALNRQSLAIVSLPDGKVTTLAGVRSFRLARDNGTWVAYVPEPDSGSADSTNRGGGAAAAGGGRGGRGGRGGGGARRAEQPTAVRIAARAAEPRHRRRRAVERCARVRVRRQRQGARVHGGLARLDEGRRVPAHDRGRRDDDARLGSRRLQGDRVRSHRRAARFSLRSRRIRPPALGRATRCISRPPRAAPRSRS